MSNGSEHTPERCVHAPVGPDWAGLREPWSWKERALAAEAENERLRGPGWLAEHVSGAPQSTTIDLEGDAWEGFTGQSQADADDALITDPLVKRIQELRAERDELREARRAERRALVHRITDYRDDLRALAAENAKLQPVAEFVQALNGGVDQILAFLGERDALRTQLDSMTVEWGIRWGGSADGEGSWNEACDDEEGARGIIAEYPNHQLTKHLVSPWTVVEGEQSNGNE